MARAQAFTPAAYLALASRGNLATYQKSRCEGRSVTRAVLKRHFVAGFQIPPNIPAGPEHQIQHR